MSPTTRTTTSRALLAVALSTVLAVGLAGPASAAELRPPAPKVAFRGPPEPPARYVKQSICEAVERPGTKALRQLLKDTYGRANSGGITRSCSTGGASEHKEGRAYDWANNVSVPAQKQVADHFVAWLVGADRNGVAAGNAHRLGVQYVIWNRRIWNSGSGWKAYNGASPHTDHVHVSLSWDGAMGRTSWWTGNTVTRFDYGPCQVYVGEPVRRYSGPSYSPCADPVPRIQTALSGDFDNDGRTEVGTFTDGVFALVVGDRVVRVPFGRRGDIPVAGDWNGDGVTGIGVFRAGTWHLKETLSSTAGVRSFAFGSAGDRPVVGSWNGRRTGIGVKRSQAWHLRESADTGSAQHSFTWAAASDRAVSGDWDGDGVDTVGAVRGGTWFLAADHRGTGTTRSLAFGGGPVDHPVVGDWDGNRTSTPGIVRLAQHHYRDDLNGGAGTRVGRTPF